MIRVLIDANIIISAVLSDNVIPFAAFKKTVTYHGLIYII